MKTNNVMNETFSIQFSGPAFDQYDIPASALAQSLLSLDSLAKRIAEDIYGKESDTEIKVKAGFRQGSFIVDLIATCLTYPSEAVSVAANSMTTIDGVVKGIKSIINLGKFVSGKKVEVDPRNTTGNSVTITNNNGQVNNYNANVVVIYNQSRTRSLLSRLTQTLDQEGVESIRISENDSDETAETISKHDREYFRCEEGVVLTDNETEVILEVVGPMVNGSRKGWKFSEGDDGIEFTATVEDDIFLAKVKSREIKFENGTAIRAIVRTIQRKNIRTVTDRIIVEIKEVFSASQELF